MFKLKKQRLNTLFLALALFISATISQANLIVKDADGEDVVLVKYVTSMDLSADRDIFVESFYDNYKTVPVKELKPHFNSREDVRPWLNEAFEEKEQIIRQGTVIHIQAFQKGRLVGFASFEEEPRAKNAVYVRQMAIAPDCQRKGIGKELLFAIKNDRELLPDTQVIFLITRFVNEKAINFYKKLGFVQSDYMHDGYDPSKYVGFEWHVSSSN